VPERLLLRLLLELGWKVTHWPLDFGRWLLHWRSTGNGLAESNHFQRLRVKHTTVSVSVSVCVAMIVMTDGASVIVTVAAGSVQPEGDTSEVVAIAVTSC